MAMLNNQMVYDMVNPITNHQFWMDYASLCHPFMDVSGEFGDGLLGLPHYS